MTEDQLRVEYLKSVQTASLGAAFYQVAYFDKRAENAQQRVERLTWAVVIVTVVNALLVAVDVVVAASRH